MSYRGWILLSLIGCALATFAAQERQLAGIKLGNKPKDVIATLGEPTAYLLAQPPLTATGIVNDVGNAMSGGLSAPGGGNAGPGGNPGAEPGASPIAPVPAAELENTLIFLYGDKEIEINEQAIIPIWAYTVLVQHLDIEQQEMIYKVNDTYSLGITITGQGSSARVTDIIACSFEPFTVWPNEPTRVFKPSTLNLTYTYNKSGGKKVLYAGTSKQVRLGSKLDEVLKAHKWPEVFLPFVTQSMAKITLTSPAHKTPVVPDVPVKSVGGTAVGAGDRTVTVAYTDSNRRDYTFANNFIMMYPEDKVALTLINFTVVRIQIGDGVVKPVGLIPSLAPPPAAPPT